MTATLPARDASANAITYKRRLHHYETDADGVCHFSNYLRLFEEAFSEKLRSLGFATEQLEHGFAVTEVTSIYRAPLRYGDSFEVSLSFSAVRRVALVAVATVRSAKGVCAVITGKFAAIERSTNASSPLDRRLRHCLDALRQDILQEENIC